MLSEAQHRAWRDDGYLVLPGFKTAAECAAAVDRAQALVDAFEPDAATGVFSTRDRARVADAALLASAEAVHAFLEPEALDAAGRLTLAKAHAVNKIGHALHDLDPFFDAFSHGPALAALAADLGLVRPRVWQSQLIFKSPRIGGEVGWHQDASFFATAPQTVTTLWFALEAATVDNGCLWVEPGGHRTAAAGGPPGGGVLRERFVRDADDRLRMEPLDAAPWPARERAVALPVAAGTLVVFDGLLPHRSDANRSAASRLAYTLHVTDGTASYSPLNWLQRSAARPPRGLD